jgi:hypothetical protein
VNIGIREHKCNLTEGLIERSELAAHAFEEGHRIDWKNITILQSESSFM